MLTITDELDAINIMLSAIGSDPVNTLTDTTDVDVMNEGGILTELFILYILISMIKEYFGIILLFTISH